MEETINIEIKEQVKLIEEKNKLLLLTKNIYLIFYLKKKQ